MDEQPDDAATPAPEIADATGPEQGEPPAIDIEALAEKVYRLMLAEIRLDRARGLAPDDGG
jgi:hypothetical protein